MSQNGLGIFDFITNEDDLSESAQSTCTDILDDRIRVTALETDRIDSYDNVIVHILEYLRIYETEGSLYNSEHHVIIFVFVFQQKNDIDYVVEDVAHLLTIQIFSEEFILRFDLFLLHDFDKRDYLCENAKNEGVHSFQIYDMQQVTENTFDNLQRVSIIGKQQLVYNGSVGLYQGRHTQKECLLAWRRALLRFLKSMMTLLIKLLILWFCYLKVPSIMYK